MTTRKHERDEAAAYLEPPVDGETEGLTPERVEALLRIEQEARKVSDRLTGSEEVPTALHEYVDELYDTLRKRDESIIEQAATIAELRAEVEAAQTASIHNAKAARQEAKRVEQRDVALRDLLRKLDSLTGERFDPVLAAAYRWCAAEIRAITAPEATGGENRPDVCGHCGEGPVFGYGPFGDDPRCVSCTVTDPDTPEGGEDGK